jgi:hypothetical protein
VLLRRGIQHGFDDVVVDARLREQAAAREGQQVAFAHTLFDRAARGVERRAVRALERVTRVRHRRVEDAEAARETRHELDEGKLPGDPDVEAPALGLHGHAYQSAGGADGLAHGAHSPRGSSVGRRPRGTVSV